MANEQADPEQIWDELQMDQQNLFQTLEECTEIESEDERDNRFAEVVSRHNIICTRIVENAYRIVENSWDNISLELRNLAQSIQERENIESEDEQENRMAEWVSKLNTINASIAENTRRARIANNTRHDFEAQREALAENETEWETEDEWETADESELEEEEQGGLPEEKLQLIPTSQISKQQVKETSRCLVCLVDYKAEDMISKLSCDHFYH